jgi:hypothetical protein
MVLRVDDLPNGVKVRAERPFQQELPIGPISFDHNPVLADEHATIKVGTNPFVSQGLSQSRQLYIACKHRSSFAHQQSKRSFPFEQGMQNGWVDSPMRSHLNI